MFEAAMDVLVERQVRAAPAAVARVMFDPARDPAWIGGARTVDVPDRPPTEVGARTRRHGGFLGRKFSWVTEVAGFEPDRRLAMTFVEGPMRGGVTYEIRPDGAGARVSIRNQGGAGFSFPGMAWMLKRSVAKELDRLAALVERGG
jgi:uncharacterized protein YndB with AHSA1/START domain